MKPFARILLLVVLAMALFAVPAFGADAKLPADADAFTRDLLTRFDEGRFDETFELIDPVLNLEKHAYLRMVTEREIMGKAASRKVESVETVKSHADLPDGEYLKITFATAFEKDDQAKEIVVLVKNDKGYGLVGYVIHYNRWPEALRMIASGLGIVFFIMILLAVITTYVGKVVQSMEKKKKAAEKAKKEAEKARKEAEKARKEAEEAKKEEGK